MSDLLDAYLDLEARLDGGGDLDEDEQERLRDEMDRLWYAMDAEDHAILDAR